MPTPAQSVGRGGEQRCWHQHQRTAARRRAQRSVRLPAQHSLALLTTRSRLSSNAGLSRSTPRPWLPARSAASAATSACSRHASRRPTHLPHKLSCMTAGGGGAATAPALTAASNRGLATCAACGECGEGGVSSGLGTGAGEAATWERVPASPRSLPPAAPTAHSPARTPHLLHQHSVVPLKGAVKGGVGWGVGASALVAWACAPGTCWLEQPRSWVSAAAGISYALCCRRACRLRHPSCPAHQHQPPCTHQSTFMSLSMGPMRLSARKPMPPQHSLHSWGGGSGVAGALGVLGRSSSISPCPVACTPVSSPVAPHRQS